MTRVDRINLKTRMRLGALKGAYQWNDKQLAEAIGYEPDTLADIRRSSVGSRFSAIIEDLYNELLYKCSNYG